MFISPKLAGFRSELRSVERRFESPVIVQQFLTVCAEYYKWNHTLRSLPNLYFCIVRTCTCIEFYFYRQKLKMREKNKYISFFTKKYKIGKQDREDAREVQIY